MASQPSDRARKAEDAAMKYWQFGHMAEQGADIPHRLIEAFATFERETPGFAAGVEAEHLGPIGRQLLRSLGRNLTPAPPADLCADIAQKSGDAIKGQDDGR